jgi:hypothetical protein
VLKKPQKTSKNVKKPPKCDGPGLGFVRKSQTVVPPFAAFTFFIASVLSHFENEEKLTVSLTFRQLTSSRLQRKILKKCGFLKIFLRDPFTRDAEEKTSNREVSNGRQGNRTLNQKLQASVGKLNLEIEGTTETSDLTFYQRSVSKLREETQPRWGCESLPCFDPG